MPSADIVYGCDDHWFDLYGEKLKAMFPNKIWTQSKRSAQKYSLKHCEGDSRPGLGREKIHFGSNSGYQAINLAYLLGAKKIILLGYDMHRHGDQVHFFGSHPYHKSHEGPNDFTMKDWCEKFKPLAKDLIDEQVEVINATRKTVLKAFKLQELEKC